jgi:hypothetical protein
MDALARPSHDHRDRRQRATGIRNGICALAIFVFAGDTQRLFEFHSNFWLNLHHFIRAVGRGMPADAAMSEEERQTWNRGVDLYRTRYSQRDLVFDDGMVEIKNALRGAYGQATLSGITIEPELRSTLESVAPVYRKYWWPAHDAANRAWIENATALVRAHGSRIAPQLARAYGKRWPDDPIPVDLSMTAGAVGAYTTSPPHVTIASIDHPSNRGMASLEILFHESSHQWGRDIARTISQSSETRNRPVPRDLWHAVLFYNAGEVTRRVLADAGIEYVEYGVREKVYQSLCGPGCRERVAQQWNRHLDGKITMEQALDTIVKYWPD